MILRPNLSLFIATNDRNVFCSMNRLYSLPRGFGAFPQLELLDLTYNNLSEKSLPANFFVMGAKVFP